MRVKERNNEKTRKQIVKENDIMLSDCGRQK